MTKASEIEHGGPDALGHWDESSFSELVSAHQADLHAHCYRMLGSVHDAEDALQDTMLRAWRAIPSFRRESSPRTWLYRIATNVCLDAIARRPKRVLPIDYGPPAAAGAHDDARRLPDSVWIEPYPDEAIGVADGAASPEARYERREALELAFVVALQHLPGRQRATLVLRDVLGFSAREAAASLETTVPSVNGALRRARAALDQRLPNPSQQGTLRTLGDRRLRTIVGRFVDAFERADVDAILAELTDDATFAMPPYPQWYRNRGAIAGSWLMPARPASWLRFVPTRANGQIALGTYRFQPDAGGCLPAALDVLTMRGASIASVTAFRAPVDFARFDLPARLPGPAATSATGGAARDQPREQGDHPRRRPGAREAVLDRARRF